MPKQRLDRLMVARNLAASRERARALIKGGRVLVNGLPALKAATLVAPEAEVKLKSDDFPYVSRGGLKLQKALEAFAVQTAGAVCLDIGASTGGFSDCLLQHGASKIYAVDVGYGQLAWKLRQDDRVVVIERTNVRYLSPQAIPQRVDLVTVDVSFISLRLVVPAVLPLMKPSAAIIALIKPQFEVGKGQVGKGGVVRDARLHQEVLTSLQAFFETLPLICLRIIPSPILGPKGNQEFFAHLLKSAPRAA
jgi:23S rRNA (cytidine1920-2'-O)/16S rRNA (cytidine1409-2'-O)-methyltransferase